MKIALAQINPIVGDLSFNTEKIVSQIKRASKENADLVVFPELAITGYPPEDLVLKPKFVKDNLLCLKKIVSETKGISCYVGFIEEESGKLYNSAAFISNCKIVKIYRKINLPNYSVFDEKRYFAEGKDPVVVSLKGKKIGLGICEDIWAKKGPYLDEVKRGAKIIININASPYHIGKNKERIALVSARAKELKAFVVYLNMVGGQDELVFDGGSMVFDGKGKGIAFLSRFEEDFCVVDLNKKEQKKYLQKESVEESVDALILGLRDYVSKNGFNEVLIGLSGGIDSALTLVLASYALGSDKVFPVFMPSKYTSKQSLDDSREICRNLGIKLKVVPINSIYDSYLKELTPYFMGKDEDITEENLQARIRGMILMAFSNKMRRLVLTTGNKSETSTGYCTLYGDMAGGFNVLKDVPKTLVYEMSEFINRNKEVIPKNIIKRAPTAELRPNQKDQDSLPPYDILDRIIELYVEKNKSYSEIVKKGFDPEIVKKTIRLIDACEYKRRQAPPGPRITKRAFGKDWRLPITNKYNSTIL